MEKALLDRLSARAAQKERERQEMRRFSVGEVEMDFRKPAQMDLLTFVGALGDAESAQEIFRAQMALIYDCCPALQDPALHEAIGVIDPMDVPLRLMDIGEIGSLAAQLGAWLGITAEDNTLSEDLAKNS